MNILFYLFFSFGIINIILSEILIWDLEKSSVNLFPNETIEYSKNIYEKDDGNQLQALLKKNIEKSSSGIKEQNYISMKDNDHSIKETNWEDIDFAYFIYSVGHFVCPKGSYFLNQYDQKDYYPQQPEQNKKPSNDWELICHYQKNYDDNNNLYHWVFQAFLNAESFSLYGVNLKNYKKDSTTWEEIEIDNGLFDFIINENPTSDKQKFLMVALTLDNNKICLRNLTLQLYQKNPIQKDLKNSIILDSSLGNTNAYFDHNTNLFYWITYRKINNFKSGYSTEPINMVDNKLEVNTKTNVSPFNFSDNAEIHTLKMIRNTRFAYYNISDNGVKYRGILDIELNQIIFNTNIEISTFKPLTNYSLLAITDQNAYEICAIKYNDQCINRCPDGTMLFVDNIKGNYCEIKCEKNQYITPDNKCISTCDTSIYIIKDNKYCGLCKDFYKENQYKILNIEGCIRDKPDNTYIYEEEKKILDYCSDGCKNCLNRENCDECKNKFYYYNGYCVDKCKEGFYENIKNCSKCHDNCEKCSKGAEIENGVENQNCDSCRNDLYLITIKGYGKNCTDNCPNNSIKSKNFCVLEEESSFLLTIYSIIVGTLLVFFTIYIYLKLCRTKKSDFELIGEISSELQENNKSNKLLVE